jgi:hypothetical protein
VFPTNNKNEFKGLNTMKNMINYKVIKYVSSFNRKTRRKIVLIMKRLENDGKLLPGQYETALWGKRGAAILSYSNINI